MGAASRAGADRFLSAIAEDARVRTQTGGMETAVPVYGVQDTEDRTSTERT